MANSVDNGILRKRFSDNLQAKLVERDNGYDNRVAGLDSPSQNRKNPPLRFIVLLSRVLSKCCNWLPLFTRQTTSKALSLRSVQPILLPPSL